MTVDTMETLFVDELKDLYSAETQITKALPKMAKAASSNELKSALEHHLKQTEEHVDRLDRIFEILGSSPKGKTCDGIKGILDGGSQMLRKISEGEIRDEAMIASAQPVEHYEMAGYGTARSYAEYFGQSDIAQLLQTTLEEERAADKKLTDISHKVLLKGQPM